MGFAGLSWLALLLVAGCRRTPEPKQYEVIGQILDIKPEQQEVLVKHEDIPGFMPAMTMPYTVNDAGLLEGKQPGDLITATLVVGEVDAYLSTLTRTGHAPVEGPAAGPVISASDLLSVGDEVPAHNLVDQDRAPRLMASLRGHRVALTFIYTRCPIPDFCPLMDRNFAEVQQQIERIPQLADVRLVSVTLDPSFDTPDVLKAHARALQANPRRWYFVTGHREEVLAFAKRFGVTAEPGDPSWTVVHNLRTAVIDPDGRLVKVLTGNAWTPAELIAHLKAVPAPAD